MPVDYDIISSDNGLSPVRRQAIIWTDADILPIGPLKTNVSEIWIVFVNENVYLKNFVFKMAAILSRSQCVCLKKLRISEVVWQLVSR